MSRRFRLAFIVIVLFQVLFLLGLAAYKEALIASGTTVVLQTAPVDPRDPFRGDYVRLRYEVSDFGPGSRGSPTAQLQLPLPVAEGATVYVRLEEGLRGRPGVWDAAEVSLAPGRDWDVYLRGTVESAAWPAAPGSSVPGFSVKYGIEQYFVPEGRSDEIRQAEDMQAEVTVDRNGDAVVRRLIVDGKPWE